MAQGKKGRRISGSIRRLPSGRYQARRRGPDGRMYAAPVTFATKAEADRWLAAELTEQAHGLWIDPKAGKVALKEYSAEWMRAKAIVKDGSPRFRKCCTGLYLLRPGK